MSACLVMSWFVGGRQWQESNSFHCFLNLIVWLLVILALFRKYMFAYVGRKSVFLFLKFCKVIRLLPWVFVQRVCLFVCFMSPLPHQCIILHSTNGWRIQYKIFSNSIFYVQIMYKHSPEHCKEHQRFCLSSFLSLRFSGTCSSKFFQTYSFTFQMSVF